jgi:hypothetical protein
MTASDIKKLYPSLAKVLNIILSGEPDRFPKRKKIDSIIAESGIEGDVVFALLALLAIFGFIEVGDDDDVIVATKYPDLAISALRKRLDLSIPIANNLRDSEKNKFYKEFTQNLENVRKELQGDNTPIHSRELVNLIIKGRQIRNWKYEDVYLHVFHSEWNEYHLVGLGERGEGSIEALAHKAMKQRLNLEPFDYEIDPNINPPSIEYVSMSKSHGALTHYTINTRVIKSIKKDLNDHLQACINKHEDFSPSSFKWFTLKEVQQRAFDNITIMESTPRVLNGLTLPQIPVTVPKARRFQTRSLFEINFRSDLPNRVDLIKAIPYIFLIVFILLVFNNFSRILILINVQTYWLDNLNSIFTIISVVLSMLIGLKGYKNST